MMNLTIDEAGNLTIPADAPKALGLVPDQHVALRTASDALVLSRSGEEPAISTNPFAMFTEWADEVDRQAFDHL
jgi:bifunctional DNA-binding transcriptional regulator/antitoxin component of YhaV-PrlF toxin-antitoxin module